MKVGSREFLARQNDLFGATPPVKIDWRTSPRKFEHPAIIGQHVIATTRETKRGTMRLVATCRCKWQHGETVGADGVKATAALSSAIDGHYVEVIEQAERS
jgi:hypothetical protein